MEKSGILPFRQGKNGLEFLIGLPGEPMEPHNKRPGFYGTWNIFKGHTDGEDVKTAAIREFCEETGLSSKLVNDNNLYDLGLIGGVYTFGLDVSQYDIDINSLHSNMVMNYLGYKPFPEIGKYMWATLPINVSIRKNAVAAMEKITRIMNKNLTEEIVKRITRKVLNEMNGAHVSHANFDEFNYDNFGRGEGNVNSGKIKVPAHGYGTYVALNPDCTARYFLQAIRSDHYDANGDAQAYYYDIEIPDVNDSNYLFEKYPISKIPNQVSTIKKKLLSMGINLDENHFFNENMSCKHLMTLLGYLLSGEEYANLRTIPNVPKSAAGGLLIRCGVVGMIYYGHSDKMCAVIFDPSQVKIRQKTNMRDVLGDIQPKNDNDRKRVQKTFANSDFYRQRKQAYDASPFDGSKYNDANYVNDTDDKDLNNRMGKWYSKK